MESSDTRVPVDEFNASLWRRYHNGKIKNVYPLIKYNEIIEKIKTIEENSLCNTTEEYYLLRKFTVINVNGKERLSCKPEHCALAENSQETSLSTEFYVALEEIYGFLNEAHKWLKHGSRDRIVHKLQSLGIVNITRDTVDLFLSFCKHCRPGRNSAYCRNGPKSQSIQVSVNPPPKNINESPLTIEKESTSLNNHIASGAKHLSSQNNTIPQTAVCTFTRGFIDLIDFSFSPDGDYRYVFLYMDVQTSLCALYPVRCKCSFEIVSHLLSVFTLLGSPQVLHSNFENSFLFSIIQELKQALPELILVSGSTNYTEVQEVAQNCISEVNTMLKTWMFETKSNQWSYGLKLVQLKKNTKIPCNSTKSSYECFFGHPLNSNLSPEVDISLLKTANTEENLMSLINEQNLSENEQNHSPLIKSEPLSDTEAQTTNGFEISDSSNDSRMSQSLGNLEQRTEVFFYQTLPETSLVKSTKTIQKSTRNFPLPNFSSALEPLLNGYPLSDKEYARLSSKLKAELISFLNRENLITTGNTSTLRWQYRNLGETLASKYPKMVWDSTSHRQKKVRKENAAIYSVFIRRLSERRKMQRLRKKAKEMKNTHLIVNIVDPFKVPPEEALSELESITAEEARNSSNINRIKELLKRSYEIRQKENLSELPVFLLAQTYLETEVELRLESSMAVMERKLMDVLMKMAEAYSVPNTIIELEKLMQPKRARWNAITMGKLYLEQKRPGPFIFFGDEKLLLIKDQILYLEATCSLERACILLLGLYFILNLNFPAAYRQFLGLLQNILVIGKKFPTQFSSKHLLQVTKNLM